MSTHFPATAYEDLAKAASVARLASQTIVSDAAQVQQLTTYEVLTGLSGLPEEAAVIEPEESVVKFELDQSFAETEVDKRHLWTDIRQFVYRNVPHGIKGNRLGIQWTCIGAFASILLFIEPPKHSFWGPVWTPLGVYICINALTTVEMATGATNRNAVLRILGTTLAGFLSFAVLIPLICVGWGGAEDNYMVRWIMYYACVPTPFIWNFFIYHYPEYMHENFTYQGFGTQVYLFGSYSTRIVYDMLICTVGCYIGTILGFIGYQLFIPLRARDKLTHELSLIAFKLSYSLEPLIEFESGIERPPPQPSQAESKLGSFIRSVSSIFKRSNEPVERDNSRASLRGSLQRRESKLREWKANSKRSALFRSGSKPKGWEALSELDTFRDRVWSGLNDCLKLMEQHDEIMRHAKREHYWSRPRFFYLANFKTLHSDCKAIYYHVTSLFLLLQAQLSSTSSQLQAANITKLVADAKSDKPAYGGLFEPTEESRYSDHPCSLIDGSAPPESSINSSQLLDASLPSGGPEPAFYTPLEVLSTAKIPPHELYATPPSSLLRTSTLPNLTRRQSSTIPLSHAETDRVQKTERTLSVRKNASLAPAAEGPQAHRIILSLVPEENEEEQETSQPLNEQIAAERRQSLMAAAQEEKSDILDTLQQVKAQLTTENEHLVVPESTKASVIGQSAPSPLRVSTAGDLENLLSPSNIVSEPPVQAAQVIGLAPVVKWASVFGPLIGSVAKEMVRVLEMLGEALDTCKWNENIWELLNLTEVSLSNLIRHKRAWWSVSSEIGSLITTNLINTHAVRLDASKYDELEQKFALPWLGLTLDAYGRLPPTVKDDLWVSFENMQDRQVATIQTCVALMRRLKSMAQNTETYLALQFPKQQTAEIREKYKAEIEDAKNITWYMAFVRNDT